MDEKRHISLDKVAAISSLFSLDDSEMQYFATLVSRDLIEEPMLKEYYSGILGSLKARKTDLQQYLSDHTSSIGSERTLQNWLASTILDLAKLKGFRADPNWIQERLIHDVSIREIESQLVALLEQGILAKTADGYDVTEYIHLTPDPYDLTSFRVYRVGLDLTHEILEHPARYKPCQFFMGSFAVNEDDHNRLVALFAKTRDEFVEIAKESKNPTRVVWASNNFFRITKP